LDDGWALEVKWDGLRAQLCVGAAGWTLRPRPGRDCTTDFAEFAELASALKAHRVVLDGELVQLGDDGKPDFAAISRRLVGRGRRAAPAPVAATFVAFDVLHFDGHPVRRQPYAAAASPPGVPPRRSAVAGAAPAVRAC
jgi:bifunctional non-homologous end joining protein LigD